ncbi:MAG: hypothetical protein ABR999_10550 [Methanoregula sp.]|jgi:hypothetical protein|uniref:hypothetical protein n=1 Tax=Methanoregula sp. TaxID=2052170 RepID=UPI003D0C4677
MSDYLDKEAVLKAWEDTVNVPGTECMIKRVQRGEFDDLVARTHPDMAKDIASLALRVEAVEQKHLMDDSRLNTQEGHIDRLETALKALQEEVAGIRRHMP